MHQLQELVRLHRLGTTAVKTARALGIDRKTERRYRRRLDAAGLLDGAVDDLPELAAVKAAVRRQTTPPMQEQSSIEPWRDFVASKLATGCGPTAIHGQLVERFTGFDGSLSAVKRLCKRLGDLDGVSPDDVDIPVHTAPGQQAQIDFGYVGRIVDPATGVARKAWVFVLVLSYSRWMFAEVVFQQDIDTWLALHKRAFAAMRGVPHVVVPDNLKAAVIKAAFGASEMGTLNRSYRELARHYGCAIDPTPAFSPKKKGKVESAVKYVKTSFFQPRRDVFGDLDDVNHRLAAWVAGTANRRTHGTTQRVPGDVFTAEESEALLVLPDAPYVPVVWHRATVGSHAHATFDKRFYSVPFVHVGKQAWFRVRGEAVTLFVDDERVADHRRTGKTPWSTVPEHLPKERRDLAQRDPAHWYARADALGEEVGAYVREIMVSDEVHYPLRRVQSVVPTLEALPPERARSVVARASRYACFRPDAVKKIIREALDLEPAGNGFVDPGWANSPTFARDADEFLRRWEATDGHA